LSEISAGKHCVLAPDGVYSLHRYENEKELEKLVFKNSAQVFGTKSVYFGIKQKVESKAKIRIADGLLLDLNNPSSPKFWIVEVELSRHDVYKDVEPQIRGFFRALNMENTLSVIRSTLYEELRKDRAKLKLVRDTSGEEDSHYFIEKVLHTKPGVIVVIDDETPQLAEIVEELSTTNEVRVIEFKTYSKGEKSLHSFTPLLALEEEMRKPRGIRTWNELLRWTKPETRVLVEDLIKRIETELPTVKHTPKYRWYYFYSSKEMRPDSKFAVLMLGKRKIYVRICIDPAIFEDPEERAKEYKGWFYKKRGRIEKGFVVRDSNDFPYAMTLIKQSHELAR